MLAEMNLRGLKSYRTAKTQIEHARMHFGESQASSITAVRLRDYQTARLKEGAKRATVDREVELIVRALRLAHQENKIGQVPRVSKLLPKHGNARQGFVRPEDFKKILGFIEDDDFRDWLEFFWWTAMRNGEISSLTWGGYNDGHPALLTLFAENSKTGDPRQIPVVGPLEPVIERRLERRVESCDRIFHSDGKPFSQPHGGLRVWCNREWKAACEKAKLPGLRTYDLRRSAIRNLIHAGVPQATTMKISGHKTADTFRRYMIEDAEDIANAFRRVGEYVREQKNSSEKPKSTRTNRGQAGRNLRNS